MEEVIKDTRNSSQEQRELDLLIEVIKSSKAKSIMVFAETKKVVDKICDALRQAEIKSLPYYPDIAVQGRAMTLMLFQNGQLPVIVCNNLASRGLDTSNVQHVIQFEFAKTTVDYMQRVGRVGRMGQKGGVITNFVRPSIDSEIEKIVKKQLSSDNNWDKVLSYKTIRKRKN